MAPAPGSGMPDAYSHRSLLYLGFRSEHTDCLPLYIRQRATKQLDRASWREQITERIFEFSLYSNFYTLLLSQQIVFFFVQIFHFKVLDKVHYCKSSTNFYLYLSTCFVFLPLFNKIICVFRSCLSWYQSQ